MEEAVARGVCDERHKSVDRRFEAAEARLEKHGVELDDQARYKERQAEINQQILNQLNELRQWRAEQDKKLPSRIEFVVRQVIQWATLALLALIAAKIGF